LKEGHSSYDVTSCYEPGVTGADSLESYSWATPMPTERKTITDTTCRNAKAADAKYEIADATRGGFRLLVQPSGAKSLIFRYTGSDGVYSNLLLAKYVPGTNALAAALERYTAAVNALARKEDPKAAVNPKTDADATVTAHVGRYKKAKEPDWSPATKYLAAAELEHLVDAVGAKAIRDLTRKDVQKVIDDAAERGPHAQVATWKWVRAFFQWVFDRDDISVNPAEKIKRPRDDTKRDRYLDDREIKIVWKASTDAGGPPGALVKLLLLTGCRRTEITHLKWSEVTDTEIVLPGRAIDRKTKNRKTHRIPITLMIRRVLDDLAQTGKYVVTGADAGLGGHTKARAKIKTPKLDDWTFHDLRRSFSSGLARLKVPLEVTERCLNHASGEHAKPLVAIYQQYEYEAEVKAAFERWSDHVAALVGGSKPKEIAA
jgi:integrase